jgi:hypothetical protein
MFGMFPTSQNIKSTLKKQKSNLEVRPNAIVEV